MTQTSNLHQSMEARLFELCEPFPEPGPVFLLGAPRTGSTIIYQAVAAAFSLPFVSNFTNDVFPSTPLLGILMQDGIEAPIDFTSQYGKTAGPEQPSEGSAVMRHWFGGGHPSQTISNWVLDQRETHFLQTVGAVEKLCGKPLLIKNAWHCFRLDYLTRALPQAQFVWIRRNIGDAAVSDLNARIATKLDARSWNSATPSNIDKLQRMPAFSQVVENQFEFNRAIEAGLNSNNCNWHEIWYEDFVASPYLAVRQIGAFLGLEPNTGFICEPKQAMGSHKRLRAEDAASVHEYIAINHTRFSCDMHKRERLR